MDSYAKTYYEQYLEDPESALHPKEKIDYAEKSLRNVGVEIYRGPEKKIREDVEYVNIKVAEYERYIREISMARLERGLGQLERFESQMEHDVILREVIGKLRGVSKPGSTMNETKYYGLSLDKVLVGYDQNEMKRNVGSESHPKFFLPSLLLPNLVRTLPMKSDDYKRAFISAISSRSFNADVNVSNNVLRVVKHFRKMGVDNEEIVLNLVAEEIFVNKFNEISDPKELDQFVESELNNQLSMAIAEREDLKLKLDDKDSLIHETSEEVRTKASELNNAENKLKEKNDYIGILSSELKKLTEKVSEIEESVTKKEQLDFQFSTPLDDANKELKEKLRVQAAEFDKQRSEAEKSNKELFEIRTQVRFKRWQRRRTINAAVQITLLILAILEILIGLFGLFERIEFADQEEAKTVTRIVSTAVFSILGWFPSRIIYDTWLNDSNQAAARKKIQEELSN